MRLLDISLSLVGLLVLSPVMLAAAVAVKCSGTGPILYRASRVGKDGRLFTLYKFRSMAVDAAGPRVTGRADPRVTRVGRILRHTKVDELPQLFNTLVGDMSFVGPRPEDPTYVRSYSAEQRQVLRVKPGLTSAATVVHRHEQEMLTGPDWETTYRTEVLPAKLRIELDYLSRRTLAGDARIMAQTIAVLFTSPTRPQSRGGSPWRT
jgi:lipopolysaccharide/colanic/teichoic acid biosynthesis glycosyltransferase